MCLEGEGLVGASLGILREGISWSLYVLVTCNGDGLSVVQTVMGMMTVFGEAENHARPFRISHRPCGASEQNKTRSR